jgi:hypothetical protein
MMMLPAFADSRLFAGLSTKNGVCRVNKQMGKEPKIHFVMKLLNSTILSSSTCIISNR